MGTNLVTTTIAEAKVAKTRIIPLIAMLFCLNLSGCKTNKQTPSAPPSGAPTGTASGTSPTQPSGVTGAGNSVATSNLSVGPTDGVGGNGVLGKMYEAYRVKPTELEAYREILKPIFQHLGKDIDVRDGSPTLEDIFAAYFDLKTWYIVPTSLKKIDSQVLGTKFMDEPTQQFAIQTDEEVWIDKTLFDAKGRPDQARVLLHEFFMIIATTKYKSLAEKCSKSAVIRKQFCELNMAEGIDRDRGESHSKSKQLTKKDYANIRMITARVFSDYKTMDWESFNDLMTAAELQPGDASSKYRLKDAKGKEVHWMVKGAPNANLFQRAEAMGLPFDTCYFPSADKLVPCKPSLKFKTSYEFYDDYELILNVEGLNEPIVVPYSEYPKASSSQMNLPVYLDGSTESSLPIQMKARVNEIIHYVSLFAKPLTNTKPTSMDDFALKAISLKPGIIRRVQPNEKDPLISSAGKSFSYCEFSTFEGTRLDRSLVVVVSSKMPLEERNYWMKKSAERSTIGGGSITCIH